MITVNTYLIFDGNCEEAFNFYKTVLQKDVLQISHYKDVPQSDKQLFNESDEKVMHATLQVSSETALMGCDMTNAPKQLTAYNFALYLRIDSTGQADRLFRELSEGGRIGMPMTQTFWGSYYGILTDKFGVTWKIGVNL
ncbi:MAG: VOC family protein [Flavipsychrobacter sp.]|nr:VOC family protein [Flavipsychrobacter sp.]